MLPPVPVPVEGQLPINFTMFDQGHDQSMLRNEVTLHIRSGPVPALSTPTYCVRCLRSGHHSDQCPEVKN